MFQFSAHFAQILGGQAVILTARHAMDKRQHLIFGFYKLRFVWALGQQETWKLKQKAERAINESVAFSKQEGSTIFFFHLLN